MRTRKRSVTPKTKSSPKKDVARAGAPKSSADTKKKGVGKKAEAPPTKGRGPVVRAPKQAEELKDKLGKLASAKERIRSLRRSVERNFFAIGEILAELEQQNLHEAKGYGSFEAFLEREVDLGKRLGPQLLGIVHTFKRSAAEEAGLERTIAALAALRGEADEPDSGAFLPFRSPIPPHKR